MRIAIVHDWLNQNGGAERVLEELHLLFPQAPIFTSIYVPEKVPAEYREWDIRTSFMQHLPMSHGRHQMYLPLYPKAFRSFDFSDYDLILSNSSGFAHGVCVPPGVKHINYCLTPPRFLFLADNYLERERITGPVRWLLPPLLERLRQWDIASVKGVTEFVSISRAVQDRVRDIYHRESSIIYPPVDLERFAPADTLGDFYFIAARLIPYKRVDIAVRAFSQLGLPLLVAGDGRDRTDLEAMAAPNVRFLGRVGDGQLERLYATCKAFLFPSEEDFGIAPVEAMASGRPVIAFKAGGALDYVTEGVTGAFFDQPTSESLMEAVRRTDVTSFDPIVIRQAAVAFDRAVFRRQIAAAVEQALGCPVPAGR
ncbi:MAG: glycosyltransferase family 4 protein [Dehalococcoidia bacterium]|nr:glycosyltransferase family 4 protein [Dehalococcoidia bacterium]